VPDQVPKPAKLVFVGTMNYFPNCDGVLYFIEEIWPIIQKEYPQVTLDIIGRYPPRALSKLDGKNGVRIVGEVEDVRPYLVQADISVAPLRVARGIQNKVLEAMAMGIPVVATANALEGIEVHRDEEVLVGDSPEAFAAHVIRLLRDSELRNRISKKARARVAQSYSWKSTGAQLEKVIAESFLRADRGVA
jgi:glycosyltransferase involved in cell wall biosynthesis